MAHIRSRARGQRPAHVRCRGAGHAERPAPWRRPQDHQALATRLPAAGQAPWAAPLCAACPDATTRSSTPAPTASFSAGTSATATSASGAVASSTSTSTTTCSTPRTTRRIQDLMTQVKTGRLDLTPGTCLGVSSRRSAGSTGPACSRSTGRARKHERAIMLEAWQRRARRRRIPAAFLRGLFHSDGCRVINWATAAGGRRSRSATDYPRWQFTNHSADIRELCCWALDLVEVAWRQSNAEDDQRLPARGGGPSRRTGRAEGVRRQSWLRTVRRGGLVDRVAHPVDPQRVGRAGDAGRAARDDHDEVALLDPADLEQLLVDLAHHLVGVLDRVGAERLDPPGQGELASAPCPRA